MGLYILPSRTRIFIMKHIRLNNYNIISFESFGIDSNL